MNWKSKIFVACAAAVLIASPASAFISYDGTGDPAAVDYAVGGLGSGKWSFDTPSTGFLTQGSGSWTTWLQNSASETDTTTGFFIEAGINVTTTTGTNGQVFISAGNDSNMGGVAVLNDEGGGQTRISLRSDSWSIVNGVTTVVPDGFHSVRVTQEPAGDVLLTVDGGLVGSASPYNTGFGSSELRFGDANGGGEAVWDYVVVNTNIPEPASMTLLALGGLAMLRRRR